MVNPLSSTYVPQRGDIVWLDFDPQLGHEQRGRRPALVLSDKAYNQRALLMLVCPITSQDKAYPFHVPLPVTMLPKPSFVIADQIKSLDWTQRNVALIKKLDAASLDLVTQYATGLIQGKK